MPHGNQQVESNLNALALLLSDGMIKQPGADVAIAQALLAAAPGHPGTMLVAARSSIAQRTVLHLAVGHGLSVDRDQQRESVLELLLDQPDIDVNARDAYGVTICQCLSCTCRHGIHVATAHTP